MSVITSTDRRRKGRPAIHPRAIHPDWTDLPVPVGLWLFHEGSFPVTDWLTGHHGTETGSGAFPAWHIDGVGMGLHVPDDVGGGGIDIDNHPRGIDASTFTPPVLALEGWVLWSHNNDPRLISKSQGGAEADHNFMVGALTTAAPVGAPRMRLRTGSTTTTWIGNTGEIIAEDTLVHIVGWYDGNEVRIYVDGREITLQTSGTKTGNVTGTAWNLRIGNNGQAGAPNEWDKVIYKAAIYDRLLTEDQIIRLAADPMGPYQAPRRRGAKAPAAPAAGRIMSSLVGTGGLAGHGGIAGQGGGLAA